MSEKNWLKKAQVEIFTLVWWVQIWDRWFQSLLGPPDNGRHAIIIIIVTIIIVIIINVITINYTMV